jgi:hypothetical protein
MSTVGPPAPCRRSRYGDRMGDDPDRELSAWARREADSRLNVEQFRVRRRRHVRAVGAKAERLAPVLGDDGPSSLPASGSMTAVMRPSYGGAGSITRMARRQLRGWRARHGSRH